MPDSPLVSFIIPAWNEEPLLGATLEALKEAARHLTEPSEIIVADDASTDRTADVARQHRAHVVAVNHRQIAATRNSGAREARGDLFIFIDADTIVSAELVRAAVEAMRAGAVGGGCAFRHSGRIPLPSRIAFDVIGSWLCRIGRFASGCFLFCTREAFEAVGGFDPGLYAAEEATMSRRLRRHGRFVMLRQCALPSGRKMRTHSFFEMLAQLYLIALGGRAYLSDRKGKDIWYGERRPDPD